MSNDNTFSQIFFQQVSFDSDNSFIQRNEFASRAYFDVDKRSSRRLSSHYVTCYENDVGPIDNFSFGTYLEMVNKRKEFLDGNMIVLLFDNVSKNSFAVFTTFLMELLPDMSEIDVKVTQDCVNQNSQYKDYLRDHANLNDLVELAIIQQFVSCITH